jgi:2-succinyl-6-hydroxy-2,4-cyclohexadiene-1-carboxylate synthase
MVRAVSSVVALHGFAGTGRMWDAVGGGFFAPDLPGHGTAAQDRVSFASCVDSVLHAAPPRFTLAGYSMGGRIALHVALAAPARVERLVLVSTTAGIEDAAERAARRRADEQLADEVEAGTIGEFAARWMAQPLFAGDPPDALARWREDIVRNTPAGLAASLRGVGAGAMEPLWARLAQLPMPATVLAGERDAKYRALGERLVMALPAAQPLIVVPGAGHGLAREAPEAVRAALGPVP